MIGGCRHTATTSGNNGKVKVAYDLNAAYGAVAQFLWVLICVRCRHRVKPINSKFRPASSIFSVTLCSVNYIQMFSWNTRNIHKGFESYFINNDQNYVWLLLCLSWLWPKCTLTFTAIRSRSAGIQLLIRRHVTFHSIMGCVFHFCRIQRIYRQNFAICGFGFGITKKTF